MRLVRLRHQMLIAMGLPACWTQASTQKPVEPPPQEIYIPPVRSPEPEIAMFDAKSCTIDTIVETMCGRMSGEYCDANAARLEIADNREGLYVTSVDAARASAKEFILDDGESEAWVTRLHGMGEKLDGKPGCCYSRCTPLVVGAAKPVATPLPRYHVRRDICMPAPQKGTTQPDPTNAACPQGVLIDGELRPYTTSRNDQCCYASVHRHVRVIKGRPARVDGDPRFADVGPGRAWHAGVAIDVAAIPPAVRARLAASWLEAASMEHASIAAFSATSLRLLALGAPPALIAATHRAALDEIEHARLAFALASAYAEQPLSPAAFAAAPRVGTSTLRELAIETFVDGCIGETVAALEAERAAEGATDPAVAAILRQIAADEARHAELAWQIVAWCVRRDPSIAADLRPGTPSFDDDEADDLAAHGVLGAAARRAAYDDVVREVVAPCVTALAA